MAHYSLDNLKKISRDNRNFIYKMMELFIQTVCPSLDAIELGLKEHDAKKIFLNTHKIKSNLKYFQMDGIEEDIILLENLARANESIEKLQPLIERILPVIRSTVEDLIKEKEQFA